MYFRYFVISPWKRAGLYYWSNLHLLHPRILCGLIEILFIQNKIDQHKHDKDIFTNFKWSKLKESNCTNHWERGIVYLLINKFIGMNLSLSFSLSLSLSLVQQWSSLDVTMVTSFVCTWSICNPAFYNFVDIRDLILY